MDHAIFLSASVPDPKRAPGFAKTADAVAISAAVSALVHVVLGRRPLIWGGHPAITPMIWVVAEGLSVEYGAWVHLYQSRFFADRFPEDNAKYRNTTYVDAVDGDREKSLLEMRRRLFTDHSYLAAVFIGGMGGVIDEYDLFRKHQPGGTVVPIGSTGGAALELAGRLQPPVAELVDELDYVGLLYRQLGISPKEPRQAVP